MIFGSLRNRGVLGINCRNSELISRFNPRKLYPLVDDKLRTKKLAMDHGVPVPELFGSLSTIHDINRPTDQVVTEFSYSTGTATAVSACVPGSWFHGMTFRITSPTH
jgi:hypothetical protein